MENLENLVKETLECPICLDLPTGQIFICERGHSICSKCKKRITACPVCKGGLTKIRNICAEKIASNLAKRCEYSFYGCTAQLMDDLKENHEENCSFRPFRCDLPGSAMLGIGNRRCKGVYIHPRKAVEHLRRTHNLDGTMSDTVQISYIITDAEINNKRFHESKLQARFFRSYGYLFLAIATIEASCRVISFSICTSMDMLQIQHTKDSFLAQVSVESNNSKISKSWQGAIHDNKKCIQDVVSSGGCLSIDFENILPFCKDQQNPRNRSFHIVFSVLKNNLIGKPNPEVIEL